MRRLLTTLSVGLLVLNFVMPLPAVAAEETPSAFERVIKNYDLLQDTAVGDGNTKPPELIVANIIQIALSLVGIIFVILMIYAGYLWMTARGNEEQATKARELIIQSVIGATIIFLAYFITAFVVQRIGEAAFDPLFY
ncbi:MAG: pilin [Patescibacteria group bacterium]|jgi:cytochrome bd-type quinol oxidase subunit 2